MSTSSLTGACYNGRADRWRWYYHLRQSRRACTHQATASADTAGGAVFFVPFIESCQFGYFFADRGGDCATEED